MNTNVKLPENMVVKLVGVDELLPYARNSKYHSPEQVSIIASSIERFGWTNPCLVADGVIIAGHGRVMAAKKLGLARVPCIDISHMPELDRKAYVIMDNRSAEVGASWNLEFLRLETDFLRDEGFDLELTGFDEDSLAELLGEVEQVGPENDKDPDDAPPIPDEPVSRQGDVWVLGPHKLAVGDSTMHETWDSLMQGELADICFVDPPYGVDLDRKNRLMDAVDGGKRSAPNAIKNDKLGEGEFAEFIAKSYACLKANMKAGATIYVAHSDKYAGIFRAEFEKCGFKFSQNVIWKKQHLVLGPARYLPIHEPIMVGRKPGSASAWYGGRKQTTVIDLGDGAPFRQMEDGRWQIKIGDSFMIVSGEAVVEEAPSTFLSVSKPAKSGLHQSQKPVELVERLLRNSARRGDIVVDGFGGSGSTLVAADRLGMYARLVEFDEAFADVIVRRWEHLTGRRAVHAITGAEFPGEDEERQAPPAGGDVPEHDIF